MRRELKYGVDEWDCLPWWQQVMYTRQMEVAANEQQSGEPGAEPDLTDELVYRMQADEPLPLSQTTSSGRTVSGTTDVLQQLGVNVVRVQFGGER